METALTGLTAMLLVGTSLGLLGGGGALLTVPVLVYMFGVGATDATGYSLAVVAVTSLAGAFAHWRRGLVARRVALIFAAPSLVSVYLTRAFLIPALPNQIHLLPDLFIGRDRLLMLAFAVMMAATAIVMIRGKQRVCENPDVECNCPGLALQGLIIGMIAGLFGAGGGFLIVPALVLLAHLPIRLAVGTSLAIISVQSLLGFLGSVQAAVETSMTIDWRLLTEITIAAMLGMIFGLLLSPRIASRHLRAAFGWFVLIIGVGIGIRELLS